MAANKSTDYYDNGGYIKDENELDVSIPVIPAPRQYLPRVIVGRDNKGSTDNLGDSGSNDIKNGEGEEDDDRPTWDNPLEFLLSCISMSVGLGNVWRFPSVAAQNGGGAFLIPYLVVLLFIGRPLYYLEMCLGQFSKYGQVKVWNMAPIFKGVGYGSITGVICLVTYYCSLIAITVYFFFASFAKTLPWAVCHQDKHEEILCNSTFAEGNLAALYYERTVNPQLKHVDDGIGMIHWRLALCLAFAWIVIFLSLVKGVKSSGKVAYFTAIFPYVVLLILLVRGVTLKGAWEGIKVFIKPQWGELIKPKVWYAAVEQCFFSLSTGFGPVIVFSSYNSFRQNVYKDALIISFLDTFTSLLAGVTIFSVIGNLMYETGVEFDKIEGIGGPGLAFVLYPQAIASFGWAPQLFAVLFFLMFFTLGIGSATSLTGGVITIICDQFPTWKRWLVTLLVCTVGCLLGLIYVTEGGNFMIDLVDHYGAGFVIYVMATLECIGICYIYGLRNICDDIEFMLGRHVGIYWRACWGFIIPVGLTGILVYYLVTEPEFQSNSVAYPKVATICGWLITAFALGLIPAWAIHAILTRKADNFKEKFQLALRPTHRWGPQRQILRKEWKDYRIDKLTERSKRGFFVFWA